MAELVLYRRQYLELEKIALGAFGPLSGFMNEDEFVSVVERMRLPGGAPFPLPVVLDLSPDQVAQVRGAARVALVFDGDEVGELVPESIFRCDKLDVAYKVFGTRDPAHPGVGHFLRLGDAFAGGRVQLTRRAHFDFSEYDLTPAETRARFLAQGWKTVCGFQTRNVPHRAHEYLQRTALEQCDALFIQPLVGAKKRGDYTPNAILAAYRALIDGFFPVDRVLLGVLSTAMRYAGPREALFHAIIRRNYGCTHFVVGRDHAGVGEYYGKYEAHELTRRFDGELGIEVLRFHGPFHCRACDGIVTERSCPHFRSAPEQINAVSGTAIRRMLSDGDQIRPELLRREIVESIRGLQLFIDEDAE
jgi:sulfate adenylyltransferase